MDKVSDGREKGEGASGRWKNPNVELGRSRSCNGDRLGGGVSQGSGSGTSMESQTHALQDPLHIPPPYTHPTPHNTYITHLMYTPLSAPHTAYT